MRPGDGAVDHVPASIRLGEFAQRLQHRIPDAGERPTPEPLIDAVPFAIFVRQMAPLRSGSCNPQHALEIAPIVVCRAATPTPLRWQQRRDQRPFRVGNPDPFVQHRTSHQDAVLNQTRILLSSFVNRT